MGEIKGILRIIPKAKARPRSTIGFQAGVNGSERQKIRAVTYIMVYTPANTGSYEKQITFLIRSFMSQNKLAKLPEGVALELSLTFDMPMPKSWSKKKRAEMEGQYHFQKPDLSNLIKAFEDALNDVAYKDDCQIARLRVSKRWASKGYIAFRLTEIENNEEETK